MTIITLALVNFCVLRAGKGCLVPYLVPRDVAKARRLGGGIEFLPTNSKIYLPKKVCVYFF